MKRTDIYTLYSRRRNRRGTVLLVVLVVVAFLTLGVYTFTQRMNDEAQAVRWQEQELQARMAADSGVEWAATMLAYRDDPIQQNLFHNPPAFLGVPVRQSERVGDTFYYTFLTGFEHDASGRNVRYGLIDESGKLNLNKLDKLQLTDEEMSTLLMNVPGMTTEIVASIRDWIDADDSSLSGGAESDYYETLAPPYAAKNGPLESLDELLLVKGVTPWLLYGEDANRNGLLDPNEDDGEQSLPYDNADGVLQLGWSAYLTVHSRESNRQSTGDPRIYVNNDFLTDLYDELEAAFDADTAKFITAYRLFGPVATQTGDGTSGGAASGTSTGRRKQLEDKGTQAVVKGVAEAMLGGGGTVTRAGMDLSKGGKAKLQSVYDLIGAQVDAQIDGATQTLNSPFADDPAALQTLLPQLLDMLSTVEGDFIEGRINVNQARPEVLAGLPGMTEDLMNAIVNAQPTDSNGMPSSSGTTGRTTTAWLYTDGLCTLDQMKEMEPFLTCRGDVYRAQVIGFGGGNGPTVRLEAMIDATQTPPRVVFQRELDELGRGYQPIQYQPAPPPP